MADVPTAYADIKAQLGHIIPCYAEPGGCRADDELNQEECGEAGCAFLRVFRDGVAWASQNKFRSAPPGT